MKRRVKHPSKPDVSAVLGADRALGIFVTVERKGRIAGEYDGLRPGYDGVPGALRFLASKGYFSEAAAAEALRWIQHSLAESAEEGDVRLAGELAEFLYSAGA